VEVLAADEVEPQSEDGIRGDALAPVFLGGGGILGLGGEQRCLEPALVATPGDAILAPGSSNIVDPGARLTRVVQLCRRTIPTCQLEVGGGWLKAGVFTGCSHGPAAVGSESLKKEFYLSLSGPFRVS
jgi:hypothetical protein